MKSPTALFNSRGRAVALGRSDENAIKWFQQTCKLYPKNSRASQAHAHLQNKYKISVTLGGANEKD